MPTHQVRPFLGETTDRQEALAGVAPFRLRIEQDLYGYFTQPSQRVSDYTKDDLQKREHCRNPRCQQGGLDLQQIVTFGQPGTFSYRCDGHEGSPQGRRKGMPCMNTFVVTLLEFA